MRYSDFARVIEAFGFRLDRVSGSHHIYKHPRATRVLNIQGKRGEAKLYQIQQLIVMVDELGLTMDD